MQVALERKPHECMYNFLGFVNKDKQFIGKLQLCKIFIKIIQKLACGLLSIFRGKLQKETFSGGEFLEYKKILPDSRKFTLNVQFLIS